jgi:acyl-CoA hydrolase
MDGKTVRDSALERPYYIVDADLNPRGTLYGGRLLAIIDSYAGRVAREHSGYDCVTVGLDSMRFLVPVFRDETLRVYVSLNRTWRTSMEIGAKIHVERDGSLVHVSSAYLTFVAVDDEQRPTAVPAVLPKTPDEIRRYHQADVRRRQRLAQ